MTKPLAKVPPPYAAARYDDADTMAIKALAAGTANAGQQQRALRWIVEVVCGTYDQPFRPGGQDGARATDFACGRQFVGQQIVKQINLPMRERVTS